MISFSSSKVYQLFVNELSQYAVREFTSILDYSFRTTLVIPERLLKSISWKKSLNFEF